MTVDQLHIPGAWNLRDLGGLRATDGRSVRPGVLFRSSELCGIDADGGRVLTALGIADVIDLRAPNEVAYNGTDVLPDGVRLHSAPVHDDGSDDSAPHEQPTEMSKEVVEAALAHAYARFPTLAAGQAALTTVVRTITDSSGGVLIHCAAGKDRAGWITAAVLRAAGVDESEVLADYLRSNAAIEHLRSVVIARNGDLTHVSDKVLGADKDFIGAAWQTVDNEYDGFDNYLDMIGVDTSARERLRTRLLT